MEPDVTLNITVDHVSLRLVKPDDDQQAVVNAADNVQLTIADRITVNQLTNGGSGISGVIVEDEGVQVGTYTRLNFEGASVEASQEDANTAVIVVTGGGGNVSFLPTATFYDETDDTYFYFGWTAAQTGGEWLVRRANRETLVEQDANQTSNPVYVDLDAAWPNRASLTYS